MVGAVGTIMRNREEPGVGATPAGTDTIGVAAVDNHPIVLKGIGAALAETAPDITLLAVAPSVAEILAGPGADASVVLLDLGMPRQGSVRDDIEALVAHGMKVLIFTSEERPVPVRRAIAAGASGLLLKIDPIETIAESIRGTRDGTLVCSGALAHALLTDDEMMGKLSPRQVEILRAISEGLPYKSVARSMSITESTVREHLNRAVASYRQRGQDPGNSHGLVRLAREEGHFSG